MIENTKSANPSSASHREAFVHLALEPERKGF